MRTHDGTTKLKTIIFQVLAPLIDFLKFDCEVEKDIQENVFKTHLMIPDKP